VEWSERTRLALALGVSVLAHASLIFGFIVRPPSAPTIGPGIFVAHLEAGAALPEEAVSAQPAAEDLPEPMSTAQQQAVPPADDSPPASPSAAAAAAPPMAGPSGGGADDASAALPIVEMQGAPEPDTWYPAKQLDMLPVAQVEVQPQYPERAAADSVGGEVTLLLLVDEMGEVRERNVVEADPPGVFDEAALATFKDVTFQPAMKDGRRVRSRVLVTLTFDPTSVERDDPLSEPAPAQ
jgi:protein TonB